MEIDRIITSQITSHFSPNCVAGFISNVECSVGGNLELRQTICTIAAIQK
jgi:hypothetical protein